MNNGRIFEILLKIDDTFKQKLNEIDEPNDDDETTDVRMVKKLQTSAIKNANSKINTQQEFRQAFENWFGELGVANKFKDNFNSTTAIGHIRDIFSKFNIKP